MEVKKKPYKEPMFLFTSGSLRFAAWAGWYSALGEIEEVEKWCHQARVEWVKEVGVGRRFPFLDRHDDDLYQKIPAGKFKKLIDDFLVSIKREINRVGR